jgi:hypothetical protein
MTSVSRLLISFLIGNFLCGGVSLLQAQSGRRPRKPAAPPVVEPESSPPIKSAPAPKPSLLLTVGMDRDEVFLNLPLNFYTESLRTVIEQLSRRSDVRVNDAGTITRGDAIHQAKAEIDGYVIYLQLTLDSVSSRGYGENARDAVVEYWVFAPTTAKIATSGRTYARAYQNRSVIRRPGSSGSYDTYPLNEAAKEAADEILGYFKKH